MEDYKDLHFDSLAPDLARDAMEKIRLHERLSNKELTYFDPKYLVDLLYVNIDNSDLSDSDYRALIKSVLPLYRKRTTLDRNLAKVKVIISKIRIDKQHETV